MAVLGAAALLFFGPEQLPRVARRAGNVMREIQNTSQSFIRELERAADVEDAKETKPYEPPPYDGVPFDAAAYDASADGASAADDSPAYDATRYEPPAPEPDAPAAAAPEHAAADSVSEKLAEPRPALGLRPSEPAEAAPQTDHAPHL